MRQLDHWIAFYKTKSYEGVTEEDFRELPQFGFQALLILYDDGSRQALNGDDHFFFIDGVIGSTDDKDGILRRMPGVKFGEWMKQEEYDALQLDVQEVGRQWHKENHDSRPDPNR